MTFEEDGLLYQREKIELNAIGGDPEIEAMDLLRQVMARYYDLTSDPDAGDGTSRIAKWFFERYTGSDGGIGMKFNNLDKEWRSFRDES